MASPFGKDLSFLKRNVSVDHPRAMNTNAVPMVFIQRVPVRIRKEHDPSHFPSGTIQIVQESSQSGFSGNFNVRFVIF